MFINRFFRRKKNIKFSRYGPALIREKNIIEFTVPPCCRRIRSCTRDIPRFPLPLCLRVSVPAGASEVAYDHVDYGPCVDIMLENRKSLPGLSITRRCDQRGRTWVPVNAHLASNTARLFKVLVSPLDPLIHPFPANALSGEFL